jgi:hypothetical protein
MPQTVEGLEPLRQAARPENKLRFATSAVPETSASAPDNQAAIEAREEPDFATAITRAEFSAIARWRGARR